MRPVPPISSAVEPPYRRATHPILDAAESTFKVVSERHGHATIAITLDTYSHAIPAMQEEAAALIAGLVFTSE